MCCGWCRYDFVFWNWLHERDIPVTHAFVSVKLMKVKSAFLKSVSVIDLQGARTEQTISKSCPIKH
jgi:hypothetical protein